MWSINLCRSLLYLLLVSVFPLSFLCHISIFFLQLRVFHIIFICQSSMQYHYRLIIVCVNTVSRSLILLRFYCKSLLSIAGSWLLFHSWDTRSLEAKSNLSMTVVCILQTILSALNRLFWDASMEIHRSEPYYLDLMPVTLLWFCLNS